MRGYEAVRRAIPPHVKLVAVSKSATEAQLAALYSLGQRDFGENRADKLAPQANDPIARKHLWDESAKLTKIG